MIPSLSTIAYRYWHADGGMWWLWPTIIAVGAAIALIAWPTLYRGRRQQRSPLDRARQILDQRYANGEIDTEEYQRRRDHLR